MYCVSFLNFFAIDDDFAWFLERLNWFHPRIIILQIPLCAMFLSKIPVLADDLLKFLEGFYNNKFGISITTLSWFHLFNILVVSLIYLFPHEPEGRKKKILPQKTNLSYIVSMALDEMVLPVCDQGYSNVWEAVV